MLYCETRLHVPLVTSPSTGLCPAVLTWLGADEGHFGFSSFPIVDSGEALVNVLFFDQVEKTEIWGSWGPSPGPHSKCGRFSANSQSVCAQGSLHGYIRILDATLL